MTRLTVKIDEKQIRRLQRVFKQFPKEIGRVMQHSINRTATRTRKSIVDILSAKNPGLKKKDIRKSVRFGSRATRKRWSARINVTGRGIPIINMGAKLGRLTKMSFVMSVRQSGWFFKNILQPKFAGAAVYKRQYTVTRKVRKGMSYKEGNRTISLDGTGAFVATMSSGHKGIFQRREGFGGRAVREMYGPSVGEMLLRTGTTLQRVESQTEKNLETEIDKRTKTYLAAAKAKLRGAK